MLLRANDETVSKIGCPRRPLENDLLLLISRRELHDQFSLFGKKLDRWISGKRVTIMPIMHGGCFAWQRLMRELSPDSTHHERIIVAQSYGDGQTAVPVKIYMDWILPVRDITNRHIVLIDDILDSGDTTAEAIREVSRHQPASISTFFMLRKYRPRNQTFDVTWVMFDIDDCWVVGAGLDDKGMFRHLQYIAEKPRNGAGV